MTRKLTLLALVFSVAVSAQKIERSKDELGKRGASGSAANAPAAKGSSEGDDGCNPFLDLFFDTIGAVFKYGLIGDYNNEDHLYNHVAPYPYVNQKAGNFTQDSLSGTQFRIDFEDQFLYNSSRMLGNHMKAKIRPFQYLYVQADYRELFERRIDNTTDNLALMHLNLCYDRLRFERFNLGWNIGLSYVGSEVRKAGFCYGLSADYFAGKRISFSASVKWSRINAHPVNTYEFNGRFHHRQFFASLGFQHMKMATPTYNFIAIGGGIYL